jgi:hypothetical protein
MSPSPRVCRFNDFSLLWAYQGSTPEMRERIVHFWREHGAVTDPGEAWRRTFEVGCITVDRQNEIAGVTSIYIDKLTAAGPTLWMYRMFIRPNSRFLGLACSMFDTTARELQTQFGPEKGSPVGLCAVIENSKLLTRGGIRHMQRQGLRYIGPDYQDRQIWVRYFSLVSAPDLALTGPVRVAEKI